MFSDKWHFIVAELYSVTEVLDYRYAAEKPDN